MNIKERESGESIAAAKRATAERAREKITLSDGLVDHEFEVEASISLESGLYLILIEVHKDGRKEEEGLVFRLNQNETGDEVFSFISDDETIDAVFTEYYRILDSQEESGSK